jgi:eukaryotic-like serine/threonine-protein kinase
LALEENISHSSTQNNRLVISLFTGSGRWLFCGMKVLFACLFLFCGLLARSQPSIPDPGAGSDQPDIGRAPTQLWKLHAGGAVFSSPVVSDGLVYFGALDSLLYAVDIQKGSISWTFRTQGQIRSTVCIKSDRLFLAGGDGILYCLDKKSGVLVWKWVISPTAIFLGERKYDFADYYHSSPIFYNNVLYFGSGDGRINAVSADKGKLVWSYQADDIVHGTPAIFEDKLFVGSFGGNVFALQCANGNLVWKFKSVGQAYFPKGEMQGSPVVANGLVFVAGRDYNVYALDADKGYSHWNRKFNYGWGLGNAVHDSVLFVGTSDDRALFGFDPETGRQLWKTDVKFNIFGPPAFTHSLVYVGTILGRLLAMEARTGKIVWVYNTEGLSANRKKYFKEDDSFVDTIDKILVAPADWLDMENKLGGIFSTPALSDGRIVITCVDGSVYCLGERKG